MARRRKSASPCTDIMITAESGAMEEITSVAAMPSMPGILISMRTISGRISLISFMPCSASGADPTTSISRSKKSSLAMLSRVSAKSSTITTLILEDTPPLPAPGYCLLACCLRLSPNWLGQDVLELLEDVVGGDRLSGDRLLLRGVAEHQVYGSSRVLRPLQDEGVLVVHLEGDLLAGGFALG